MTPRIPLALALAAPLVAFAASSTATSSSTSGNAHTFSASVSPGGIHEECVKLAKDESRHFEWKSDAAVDFNIHYHEGKEVFYPVKRDSLMKDKGTFKAKVAQDYCWMWSAKSAAKVEGTLKK